MGRIARWREQRQERRESTLLAHLHLVRPPCDGLYLVHCDGITSCTDADDCPGLRVLHAGTIDCQDAGPCPRCDGVSAEGAEAA